MDSTNRTPQPVSVWAGASPDAQTVPQVRAALAVLTRAGLDLAQISATGHAMRAGAYLDPRSGTGEVVLSYEPMWGDNHPAYSEIMRRAMVKRHETDAYRELFHGEGWQVEECNDPNAGGSLPRFVLAQPQDPKDAPPSPRRTTRREDCEDCGERVEVEPDGFRTLCACDAAE